eukprot:4481888-Amphidinium_carterae.1
MARNGLSRTESMRPGPPSMLSAIMTECCVSRPVRAVRRGAKLSQVSSEVSLLLLLAVMLRLAASRWHQHPSQ